MDYQIRSDADKPGLNKNMGIDMDMKTCNLPDMTTAMSRNLSAVVDRTF